MLPLLLLSILPLLRPASIRIMLISVSSFKIIQINCGIYLGSFFPARSFSLSHAGTHKELNSRARDWLTKNDQNINTLMHIPLFGLDHLLLLLFWFLLPHLGSVAVLKLSHKVWADSLTGSWTYEDCMAIRSKIRYQVRLSITAIF